MSENSDLLTQFLESDFQAGFDWNRAVKLFAMKRDVEDAIRDILILIKERTDKQHIKNRESFESSIAKISMGNQTLVQAVTDASRKAEFIEEHLQQVNNVVFGTEKKVLDFFKAQKKQILKAVQHERQIMAQSAKGRMDSLFRAQMERLTDMPTRGELEHFMKNVQSQLDFFLSVVKGIQDANIVSHFEPQPGDDAEGNQDTIEKLLEIEKRIEERIKNQPVAATFPVLLEPRHGSRWYFTSGVPSRDLGENNDAAIDMVGGDAYKKIDGNWVSQGTLPGGGGTTVAHFTDTTTAHPTYGSVTPAPDGIETIFSGSQAAYDAGSLRVFWNGGLQTDFTEDAANGDLTMGWALPGGELTITYTVTT